MEADGKGKGREVVMVGVVPPPFHGQGIATRALFDADLPSVSKSLVEIRSSRKITEVGKPSLGKLLGILGIVARVLRARLRTGARVLYYTAGSGAWVPFVRDLVVLGICRPFFRVAVIHYHSGNVVDFLDASPFRALLGRHIYGRGAWSVRLGEGCPVPDERFGAARVVTVPNGIGEPPELAREPAGERFRILFLGNLFEEKGVLDLIEAVRLLGARGGPSVELSLVGAFPDQTSEALVAARLGTLDPAVAVKGPAPAYGAEKWAAFANADVFVFPSYYERENMPLVVLEAMAAGLPVIATRWRGIPSLIEDGSTGFLVDTRDPEAIAESLSALAADRGLAASMGSAGRRRFERDFTSGTHLSAIDGVLSEALRA